MSLHAYVHQFLVWLSGPLYPAAFLRSKASADHDSLLAMQDRFISVLFLAVATATHPDELVISIFFFGTQPSVCGVSITLPCLM
jgi:hypothetical protein